MKKHVQDVASHQHLNNIQMNKSQRNFGIIEELFEKRRKGKVEPRIELLLTKKEWHWETSS